MFYLLGIVLVMISLPVSHFLMGLSTFLLLLNWIAEWNWRDKWARLKQHKGFLVFSFLFVFLLLGLIRANDPAGMLHKLTAKLVLFFAPLIVATTEPLTRKERIWTFAAFVFSTLFGCLYSLWFWHAHPVHNVREISTFIDHIRFSLCVVMSVVFSMHYFLKIADTSWKKVCAALLAVLFVLYLFLAQTLTGILILIAIMLAYSVYLIATMRRVPARRAMLWTMVAVVLTVGGYVAYITYDYFHDQDVTITETTTMSGNPYTFDDQLMVENGHRIGYYVCTPELHSAWAARSDSALTPWMECTLIRYLNSKGLHKDSAAVMSLSAQDIRNVENDVANYDYTRVFGMRRALYPTYFCISLYRQNRCFDNSSLLQRVELWRISWELVRENWLFGVGLDNVKTALNERLLQYDSPIITRNKQGCHNQYLTFWLSAGILFLLYFIFVLVYPFVWMRNGITFVYVAFAILMIMSFFTEDTLETQTGCIMFAVMNPLLLMAGWTEHKESASTIVGKE
ncbi:MAG: O-antigen ligase family protein [Bacteroidales bacterium]|nr:O-antigen ligase family protein [Bacteroidales bacterium]